LFKPVYYLTVLRINPANTMKSRTISILTFSILAVFILTGCKKDDERRKNSIFLIEFDPESPANLNFGDNVVITTDYYITHPDGARFWVQPFTDGNISPGYVYSSSGIFEGTGIREVGISVNEGDTAEVVVDQLRVVCSTPDQDETLYEEFIDVNYTFGN